MCEGRSDMPVEAPSLILYRLRLCSLGASGLLARLLMLGNRNAAAQCAGSAADEFNDGFLGQWVPVIGRSILTNRSLQIAYSTPQETTPGILGLARMCEAESGT